MAEDFLAHTLKVKGDWSEIFQAVNKKQFPTQISMLAKLFFKVDGEIKTLQIKPTTWVICKHQTSTPKTALHTLGKRKSLSNQKSR